MKTTGKKAEAATGSVLWKTLILKFLQHYKKTPLFSVFLIKLQVWRTGTLFKRKTGRQVFSCGHYINFKSTYFEEHLRTAAFEREVLVFHLWDFEVLPLGYNGNFSIFFQLIFYYGFFVRLFYAKNATQCYDYFTQ